MGRGGEGGNEASNFEVLLFKVEVVLSKLNGHDLSDEHHDSSDEQVCLKSGLMIKRLYHRTVIIPQQVPLAAVFVGCLKMPLVTCCHL